MLKMILRPKDLGVEGLETDGFVPMLRCGDYSKHATCTDGACVYAREISEAYRDMGLLEEVDALPKEQHDKLYGVLCRDLHESVQRDFMLTGFGAAEEIINFDGRNCAYVAIRGSTSRGSATPADDVDLFIISDVPDKTQKYSYDISNTAGERLKEKHPELKRSARSLVAPIVIPFDYYDDFVNDPVSIDSDPRYIETMYLDPEKVAIMHSYLERKVRDEHIFEDPGKDPFRFAAEAIYPPSGKVSNRKHFGLKEKDRTHNMAALLTRLYGVKIVGDVPQFHVTRLRDEYLLKKFRAAESGETI